MPWREGGPMAEDVKLAVQTPDPRTILDLTHNQGWFWRPSHSPGALFPQRSHSKTRLLVFNFLDWQMFEFDFNKENQSTRPSMKKEQRVWIRTQLGLLRNGFVTGAQLPHCQPSTEWNLSAWQGTIFLSTVGDGIRLMGFSPNHLSIL